MFEGDKCIVLVDGEFVGVINWWLGEGEFCLNFVVGGYVEVIMLIVCEEEICVVMGFEFKVCGLVFVGIDVIGGKWLIEINVILFIGIVVIDKFNGIDIGGCLWDVIEMCYVVMLGG